MKFELSELPDSAILFNNPYYLIQEHFLNEHKCILIEYLLDTILGFRINESVIVYTIAWYLIGDTSSSKLTSYNQ